MKNKTTILAIFALIGANVFWSFSYLFTKVLLDCTTPFTMLAYRFIFAFALLNLLLLTGKFKVNLKGVKFTTMLLLGLFEPVITFTFNGYALLSTSSSFVGIMNAFTPVASLLASALFLKESANKKQVLLAFVSIACLVVIVITGTSSGSTTVLGIIFMIISMCSSLAFGIVMRKTSVNLSTFDRTYAMFMMAAIIFTVLAVLENISDPVRLLAPLRSTASILELLYLSGCASVLAYLFANFAIAHVPLYRVTSFTNLNPILAALAGILILHEPCNVVTLIFAGITVICVYGMQKFASKDEPTEYLKNTN